MGWLLTIAYALVEQGRLIDRLPMVKLLLQPKMLALYGDNRTLFHTKRFAARALIVFACCVVGAIILFFAADGDWTMLTVGLLFALCTPWAMVMELDRKIKRKKQLILLELPELLNRLTLLLNAGDTIHGAWMKCAAFRSGPAASNEDGSPLQKEIALVAVGLSNREPLPLLLEQFSKRCAVQEVTVFTTTVLMNYRRGGDSFVLALKGLSNEMWERRKALTRTLGEEASSKLIFPMLLIFLVVMAIVAAPAVTMMNEP